PFLGVGIRFPLSPNTEGDFQLAAYEESVRQSILIILGTAKGERVMRPDFGCGIYDLVFEPNSPATAGRVSQAIQEALLIFEPRIDVIDVQVNSVTITANPRGTPEIEITPNTEKMLVSIDYQVRATNNVFNLVYPFYLEGGAG
ncbi:MAG: GPW/gp25 family protein, partial [Symploca sp. SIO2E6]|nr:GPW/gp25 family protein [Symploca sp. SIO2E6]